MSFGLWLDFLVIAIDADGIGSQEVPQGCQAQIENFCQDPPGIFNLGFAF